MIWRQAEPPTNLHQTVPPTPSFTHGGIEHEATNWAVLPELHPPAHQGYYPQNTPSLTFNPPTNDALPPSLHPQPDAANAHFYGFPIQPFIPGSPSVTTTTSIASGPKFPIFSSIFPDASRSPPTTTISLQVAFPSQKSFGSPDFMPRMMENTAWGVGARRKKSRGRSDIAAVPSPLAVPSVPDTVAWKRKSSPILFRELGEMKRGGVNEAKTSTASFDNGCVCPPVALCFVDADPPFR